MRASKYELILLLKLKQAGSILPSESMTLWRNLWPDEIINAEQTIKRLCDELNEMLKETADV